MEDTKNLAYDDAFAAAQSAMCEEDLGNFAKSKVLLLEAINSFLQGLQLETDDRSKMLITNKIEEFMDKAKILAEMAQKQADSGTSAPDPEYLQAFKKAEFLLEQAVGQDEAGRPAAELYIDSAEIYMRALKEPGIPDHLEKTMKSRLTSVLARAEQLKGVSEETGGVFTDTSAVLGINFPSPPSTSPLAVAGHPRPPFEPVASGRPLSAVEKDVLRRSSVVNGKLYVPWQIEDVRDKYSFSTPFTDPDGLLPLSAKQKARLAAWKRPSAFVRGGDPTMIDVISAYTVTQTCVGDCSFVASLCICAAYERRFKKALIPNKIYPQNRHGQPVYNPSGKYIVKLKFNGIWRKVVVDDLLPVDSSGNLLCSFSNNRRELWVSILEKAYMKVNGGYDFPGSNSSIDLHALTGWLPELLTMQDKSFDKERQWERLVSGAKFGDVLITIATGEYSSEEEERWGLVSCHAYAVLDAREVNGLRLLQVKNPWATNRWKGPYSANDSSRWTPYLKSALQYNQLNAMQHDNGIFWIDYASVLERFRGLYFNWNPELFKFHNVQHSTWPVSAEGPKNDTYNVGYNPQFALDVNVPQPSATSSGRSSSACTAACWIILTRHSKTPGAGEDTSDEGDFLTLHVYKAKPGERASRIFYPRGAFFRGTYRNGVHSLIRFDIPPGRHSFSIVVSQYDRKRTIDYSLDVYCMSPFSMTEIQRSMAFEKRAVGEWKEGSAGGCPRHSTFGDNPQYLLEIPSACDLLVQLQSPVKFNVNIRLTRGRERIRSASREDEVITSGDYRPAFCYFFKKAIPAGPYIITASTFSPGKMAKFILAVGASRECLTPFNLTLLPPDGYGMSKRVLDGGWSNSPGCSNHGRYAENPHHALRCSSVNEIYVRLCCPSKPALSINVSVFDSPPSNSPDLKAAVASSNGGVFTNNPAGVTTEKTTVPAGRYIIVCSTFEKGVSAEYQLTVFSRHPVAFE